MKEYILNFIKYQLHEHCGRTIGVILGFIISLAILIFGLFATLFVIVCMGIGLYVGNLIADIIYNFVDPRIKEGEEDGQ